MERNCDNCKYRDVYYNAPPCDECNFEYQRQPQKGFQNWEPDAMTNADRFRAMSAEEIATFIIKGCQGRECPSYQCVSNPENEAAEHCWHCWLDWLKEEEKYDYANS